jgi:hypothetical protein
MAGSADAAAAAGAAALLEAAPGPLPLVARGGSQAPPRFFEEGGVGSVEWLLADGCADEAAFVLTAGNIAPPLQAPPGQWRCLDRTHAASCTECVRRG